MAAPSHEIQDEEEEVTVVDKEDEIKETIEENKAPDMPTLTEDNLENNHSSSVSRVSASSATDKFDTDKIEANTKDSDSSKNNSINDQIQQQLVPAEQKPEISPEQKPETTHQQISENILESKPETYAKLEPSIDRKPDQYYEKKFDTTHERKTEVLYERRPDMPYENKTETSYERKSSTFEQNPEIFDRKHDSIERRQEISYERRQDAHFERKPEPPHEHRQEQLIYQERRQVNQPVSTEKYNHHEHHHFLPNNDQMQKQERNDKKRGYDSDYLKKFYEQEYQKKAYDPDYLKKSFMEEYVQKRYVVEAEYQKKHAEYQKDLDLQKKTYDEFQKRMADVDYQKRLAEADYQKRLAEADYQRRMVDVNFPKVSIDEYQKRILEQDYQRRGHETDHHKRSFDSEHNRKHDQKPAEIPKVESLPKDINVKNKSIPKNDEREHKHNKPEKESSKHEIQTAPQSKIPNKSPPPIVIIDDSERNSNIDDKKVDVDNVSGNTTPRLDHSVEMQQPSTPNNPGSVKQTPPQPEIPSMGVYTPDSTTNSVHSLHGYGQCDLDVSQLGLESPTSISSNDMPPSVGAPEPARPPSSQAYTDCAQQQSHPTYHHPHHVTSSPQHCPPALPQYQTASSKSSSSRSKSSQSVSQHHSRNRSTPPAPSRHHPPPLPTQQPYPHHHPHSQPNYSIVPQLQQSGTYAVGVPMTMATVIQHRMTQGSQASPNQRVPSTPSCSVPATNFYIQSIQPPMHPHSHTPVPSPTTAAMSQTTQSTAASCNQSLNKLQQLTNGLEMIPPSHCANMTPPPPMNLTPPPSSHSTMTPPPSAHQMLQQPNLANYHKFYQSNMAAPTGRSSSRSSSVQMPPSSSTSRPPVSPNVTLNHNLMAGYQFNGYRMGSQQSPAYINTAGFINQGQIPVQMMNMAQSQYAQDPAAIQQNTMYTTYGYINSNLPLSTLRR